MCLESNATRPEPFYMFWGAGPSLRSLGQNELRFEFRLYCRQTGNNCSDNGSIRLLFGGNFRIGGYTAKIGELGEA
jgi:hypothetical protein